MSTSAFSLDRLVGPIGGAPNGAAAPAPAAHSAADVPDARWGWDDPTTWLVLLVALGTGIIGFRFHWGPGVSASAKVDIADEAASVLGHAFLTIGVIVLFKALAFRSDVPSLEKLAYFI